MLGSPPPPPPPPAFKSAGTPRVTKPAKRLKPFFWNKLGAASLDATIWTDVSSDISLDFGDLEATFTIENVPTPTSSQMTVASKKTQGVTTLLDITRSQNIGDNPGYLESAY
jgi:diaphanous 1